MVPSPTGRFLAPISVRLPPYPLPNCASTYHVSVHLMRTCGSSGQERKRVSSALTGIVPCPELSYLWTEGRKVKKIPLVALVDEGHKRIAGK
ncbi:hypothetical protein MC885_006739 [Smutsia gigantea]|nr:hypothetical protein MC885_006739 [Smutsia gigantea]